MQVRHEHGDLVLEFTPRCDRTEGMFTGLVLCFFLAFGLSLAHSAVPRGWVPAGLLGTVGGLALSAVAVAITIAIGYLYFLSYQSREVVRVNRSQQTVEITTIAGPLRRTRTFATQQVEELKVPELSFFDTGRRLAFRSGQQKCEFAHETQAGDAKRALNLLEEAIGSAARNKSLAQV